MLHIVHEFSEQLKKKLAAFQHSFQPFEKSEEFLANMVRGRLCRARELSSTAERNKSVRLYRSEYTKDTAKIGPQ